MRVGSLFTGCGGLDLGLEAAGFEVAWAAEKDPACRRVLERQRPGLQVLADVRHVDDWLPEVDVLAGGFPCQDLSYAGRGGGLDGDRSGLWHAFADSVRLLRPRYVLVENVPGLATRGLGRVLYDLAESGYLGRWLRLRAADVGAAHGRERIFILAADAGRSGRREIAGGAPGDEDAATGHAEDEDHLARGPGSRRLPAAGATAASDAERLGRHRRRSRGDPGGCSGPARDRPSAPAGGQHWGEYEPTVRRWEGLLGRSAPDPVDARGRLTPAFVEWMLGYPDGWTEGESRTARLRMLGNSVQVQVGELVGELLIEMDEALGCERPGHESLRRSPVSMTADAGRSKGRPVVVSGIRPSDLARFNRCQRQEAI